MIEELNFSPTETKVLLVVLIVLLVKYLRRGHYVQIDLKPTETPQKDERTALQARYGAYIQSQGKYYN